MFNAMGSDSLLAVLPLGIALLGFLGGCTGSTGSSRTSRTTSRNAVPLRLVVGQRTLNPLGEVRTLEGQPLRAAHRGRPGGSLATAEWP